MTLTVDPVGPGPVDEPGRLRTPSPRTRTAARPAARPGPHLRHERVLLREGATFVAGMDEVGRGSLAGPVSVGVVVVDAGTRSAPRGVADSKLLTPAARTALLPALGRWGLARAVGHASAAEIDDLGIIAALRLAGSRALTTVVAVVGRVDVVLLDGSHDWLTPPAAVPDLFAAVDETAMPAVPRVRMRVKADRTCASVAAASVLAKCERDALMVDLAGRYPAYRWDENKGYSSPDHLAALRELGPSDLHRRSWRLPGVDPEDALLDDDSLLHDDALLDVEGDADLPLDDLDPDDVTDRTDEGDTD
ncbi:ribonuclease HII [Cellulomonas sp.]|uniref:ribonuclease HII n=1 Tax=Cellulomonas sp. TaxID=40001 RepID=UPI001B1F6DF0|nr:ribonuclease HII [Cellulomonas sp.]MBO9553743.1 ribonuclease HII [Cellulomonas sp.]